MGLVYRKLSIYTRIVYGNTAQSFAFFPRLAHEMLAVLPDESHFNPESQKD